MYGYKLLIEVLQSCIQELSDPEAFLPESPDIPDESPIFKNVEIGNPSDLSFWNTIGAILMFGQVTKTDADGSNDQRKYQLIQGAVITIVPGDEASNYMKMLHYSDIVGDFCENNSALGLPGTTIDLIESNSQGWRLMDISKFSRATLKQLDMASTATTIFQIKRPKMEKLNAAGKIKGRF
jgi:hypothetical protein